MSQRGHSTLLKNQLPIKENFDKLPDELIVLIFSHLSPEDLVLNIAQVCTRWYDIAKDPKVWESTWLKYTNAHAKQFKKVIQFAPYLSKLEFNWYVPNNDDITAIVSGCSNVKSLLWCPSSAEASEHVLRHLIKIISHFRETLQEVDILIDNTNDLTFSEHIKTVLESTLLGILSSMRNLKSLKLRGCLSPPLLSQDIFKDGWRYLETLDLFQFRNNLSSTHAPELIQMFVISIIKHKAQKLKKLALSPDIFTASTVNLFHDVCKSSSIEALKISEHSLQVVMNFCALKTLHIIGLSDRDLDMWRSSFSNPSDYLKVFDWISMTPQLLNLKALHLENVNDNGRNLPKNLVSVCKNLKYLSLFGGNYTSSQLLEMLVDLKSLEKLYIHRVSSVTSKHLEAIPLCLPNLRILDLRYCVFSDAGIFMNFSKNVLSKMPNLKLYTDYGYFEKRGGKLFNRLNRSSGTVVYGVCTFHQKPPLNLQFDRAHVSKMLDEFSDYDDDSDAGV